MVRCIKKKVTDLLRALRTVPTAFWDKIWFLKKAIAVFHMIEQNIANVQIRNTTHNKKQVAERNSNSTRKEEKRSLNLAWLYQFRQLKKLQKLNSEI